MYNILSGHFTHRWIAEFNPKRKLYHKRYFSRLFYWVLNSPSGVLQILQGDKIMDEMNLFTARIVSISLATIFGVGLVIMSGQYIQNKHEYKMALLNCQTNGDIK